MSLSTLSKLKLFNKPIIRDEVYNSVKEAILTGRIAPGERLSVGRLIRNIGFSPTPIREALLKLEQEGFVSRIPQKGGFIASQLSKKDIDEIFDLRCLLEGHAVTFAVKYITREDIAVLERNVKESEHYSLQKKFDKVSKLNTEFHDLLNGFCTNQRIISLINELRDQVFQYRSIIIKVPGKAKVSTSHHKHMIEALRRKDGESLKMLIHQHAMVGKEIIMTEIDKGNLKTIRG